jgi:hypothetical protein
MRKLVLFAVPLFVFGFGQAAANPIPFAEFGFFADATATVDTVFDTGPSVVDIYFVLTINDVGAGGASGLKFTAPKPPCLNAVFLGETYNFPVFGTAQDGVWVMLNGCPVGQFHIGTLSFTVEGLTGDCCWYVPQPFPSASEVEVEYCGGGWTWVFPASSLLINPNDCPSPSPVEESTWGRIKELYKQ